MSLMTVVLGEHQYYVLQYEPVVVHVSLTEVGEFGEGEQRETEWLEHLRHQVTHPLLPPPTPHREPLSGRSLPST